MTYHFQFCQKLLVFRNNDTELLLCRRRGEQEADGLFSYIGGKMEVTDTSFIESFRREKVEEIGAQAQICVYPDVVHLELLRKKDGNVMVLANYYATYQGGDIILNEEYSEFAWVRVDALPTFAHLVPDYVDITQKVLAMKTAVASGSAVNI